MFGQHVVDVVQMRLDTDGSGSVRVDTWCPFISNKWGVTVNAPLFYKDKTQTESIYCNDKCKIVIKYIMSGRDMSYHSWLKF